MFKNGDICVFATETRRAYALVFDRLENEFIILQDTAGQTNSSRWVGPLKMPSKYTFVKNISVPDNILTMLKSPDKETVDYARAIIMNDI